MIAFQVNDMTCGHCVGAITRAVQAVDPAARVQIDLAAHRVQVENPGAPAATLATAIKEAGYTPVALAPEAPAAAAAAARRSGCCCASRAAA